MKGYNVMKTTQKIDNRDSDGLVRRGDFIPSARALGTINYLIQDLRDDFFEKFDGKNENKANT